MHLESYWSYDLGDLRYATAFVAGRTHWVRQLPGQLFHNIISHGLAKLAEFLDDELTDIFATAHRSKQLRKLGADEVVDELRVLIRDKTGTTALFCFSTQVKGLNLLRAYGPAGSLSVDIISGSIVRRKSHSYKSYLTYFVPPLKNAREHLRNARLNIMNFLCRRLYQDFGMKELIERFYNSIRLGTQLPIPYREILLTARIMDEIFAQIYAGRDQKSQVGGQRSEMAAEKTDEGGQNTDDRYSSVELTSEPI
jgi:predicted dehydrogenase